MNLLDIFWLFLIIIVLQPLFRQKVLEYSRRRCLAQLEKKRSSRVIIMVHRQETMALLGFPIFRFIDINDSEEVIRAIHLTDPDIPLDIIIHTPGGLVLASLQIARALNEHPGKVTVFVPHYAMSGGTLIASAAEKSLCANTRFWGRWTLRSLRCPPLTFSGPWPRSPWNIWMTKPGLG
jgi:ClpP class serine protease